MLRRESREVLGVKRVGIYGRMQMSGRRRNIRAYWASRFVFCWFKVCMSFSCSIWLMLVKVYGRVWNKAEPAIMG